MRIFQCVFIRYHWLKQCWLIVTTLSPLSHHRHAWVFEVQRKIKKLFINATLMRSWNDWRRVATAQYAIPFRILEPRMALNFLNWLKSIVGVLLKKLLQKVYDNIWKMMFSIFWLIVDNAFVYLIMILVEMRWKANDQFIKKCTNTIDVRSSIMSLSKQYLGAHVLWRSAKWMRSLFLGYDLGKAKVCNFDMAIDVD